MSMPIEIQQKKDNLKKHILHHYGHLMDKDLYIDTIRDYNEEAKAWNISISLKDRFKHLKNEIYFDLKNICQYQEFQMQNECQIDVS